MYVIRRRFLREKLTFGEILSKKVQNCTYLRRDYTYPSYTQVFKLIAKVTRNKSKKHQNLNSGGRRQGLISVV